MIARRSEFGSGLQLRAEVTSRTPGKNSAREISVGAREEEEGMHDVDAVATQKRGKPDDTQGIEVSARWKHSKRYAQRSSAGPYGCTRSDRQ